MSRRQLFVSLLAVLAACLLMTPVSMAAPKNVIKLAHDQTSDTYDPVHAYALVFKSYVENATEGEYTVEIHPASVLGKERERLELTKANGIQINLASIGGLSAIYQPAILLNTPFTYKNDRVVAEVLESDFVQWMFADMEKKTGLKSINVFELGGLSCFTNNVRPIKTVADMKGIKFRAMDDSQVAMFKALGANAVPMAWSETYTGLQTGVVQGQVNPVSIILNNKINEVQKYLSISRTILGGHWTVVNASWYNKLPADIKKIVDEAFYYAKLASSGLTQVVQATGYAQLKSLGMQVSPISEEAYQEFRKLGRTAVIDWAKTKMDSSIVDRFVSTVDAIEKKAN
ncbi:MAG TPA: TRAP transporter substrate-binding protein DctP [Bacillota bacterium]|nr:TRAP transporter substrate-binding protein DctP [Bacillota bacterium]HOH09612.1 TRAP transporter substrate-binding protein DctP [Bacillota bacterium]HOS51106.1 TRAP transporter substrate-binding protein DctP [Bacillota bacterium]HOY88398.1 TRAP transporter substrate-binding protein DctP [Bacillota bacterium]HPI00896.1 TRAP transporter substrate-binding protein DctP [Bacillota bacterium]